MIGAWEKDGDWLCVDVLVLYAGPGETQNILISPVAFADSLASSQQSSFAFLYLNAIYLIYFCIAENKAQVLVHSGRGLYH